MNEYANRKWSEVDQHAQRMAEKEAAAKAKYETNGTEGVTILKSSYGLRDRLINLEDALGSVYHTLAGPMCSPVNLDDCPEYGDSVSATILQSSDILGRIENIVSSLKAVTR